MREPGGLAYDSEKPEDFITEDSTDLSEDGAVDTEPFEEVVEAAEKVKKTKLLFIDAPFHSDPALENQALDNSGKRKDIPRGALSVATYLNRHGFVSNVAVTDAFINREFELNDQRGLDTAHGRSNSEEAVIHEQSQDRRAKSPYEALEREAFFIDRLRSYVDKLVADNDPDVIAFSYMFSPTERTLIAMIREVRQKYPSKKIIVGGNAASFDDVSRKKFLDPENLGVAAIIDQEGERTMLDLVESIEANDGNADSTLLKDVPGLSYWDHNTHQIAKTERRERLTSEDLEEIGPLSYDKLILPEGMNLGDFNHFVMFTRGCKGNCAFCTSPKMYERAMSSVGLESFRQELEAIAEAVETSNGEEKNIGIMDDDILLEVGLDKNGRVTSNQEDVVDRKTIFEIVAPVLKSVREKHSSIKFYCSTRVSHLRDNTDGDIPNKKANTIIANQGEILRLMKESGIDLVLFGVESLSQEILDKTLKDSKVEWVEPALRKTKEADLRAGVFWIIGLPGSTKDNEYEALERLRELVSKGLVDELESHVLIPFPGTKVRRDVDTGKSTMKLTDVNEASRKTFLGDEIVLEHVDSKGNVLLSQEDIKQILSDISEVMKGLRASGHQTLIKVWPGLKGKE